MNTITLGTVATLVLGCLAGCGSDASPEPDATIIEFAPTTLDPSDDTADDLTIRVEYTDGDGDLGEGVAEVHDCRVADVVALFELPKIASDEAVSAGVPIEGTLEIVLADVSDLTPDSSAPSVCADLGIDAQPAGQAVFCVVLVDAAGNSGLGDCTGAVAIQ